MKYPRVSAVITCLLSFAGTQSFAETLAYQSVGEFGEPAFSDIKDPTSETIVLPASEAEGLSSDELVHQMLAVAQTLEQARLTREAQRAAQRSMRQTATPLENQNPAPAEDDRYPVFYPLPHRPGHGHHPKPPMQPTPPVKTFRFKPDL